MRNQSHHGPAFKAGFCLGSLALFTLGHPSGQDTATLGWEASKHKHRIGNTDMEAFLKGAPRGFALWWEGGTPTANHPEGDGHVALLALPHFVWSVDRVRTGFYDRVLANTITGRAWNHTHPHKLLGWTEDIAGFELPYKPGDKNR